MASTDHAASGPPVSVTLPSRSVRQALVEFIAARSILGNMVRRDFTSKHMNSFLGTAWSLLNPLLLVAVFSVVFKFLFRAQPDISYPFAVFFYGGLVVWNMLGPAVQATTTSIISNGYLIQKVYIPREIFPIATVVSYSITFVFELVVLAIFMAIFRIAPNWTVVLFPIFPALAILLAIGIGFHVSALTVKFRDFEHFVGVGVQMWFFLTPVLYSFSMFENPTVVRLLHLNPASSIVDGFRDVVLNGVQPAWGWVAYSASVTLVLIVSGFWVFNRSEPYFAELI